MSKEEQECLEHLTDAWNIYVTLYGNKADDLHDFRKSIHDAQRILAMKTIRRDYPEVWSQ